MRVPGLQRVEQVPRSMAPTVKSDLRDIWQVETRAAAQAAIDTFTEEYGTKYGNAVACWPATARTTGSRFPGRPLDPTAHGQSDRERLRHGPAPDRPDQGCALAGDGEADRLRPGPSRLEEVAPAEGRQPGASRRQWRRVYRRYRSPRRRDPRRLIRPRHPDSEKENERLRKAVSDLTLEKLILREAASGNF